MTTTTSTVVEQILAAANVAIDKRIDAKLEDFHPEFDISGVDLDGNYDFNNLRSEVSDLENKIDDLPDYGEEIEAIKETIGELERGDNAELEDRVNELEAKVDRLTRVIASLSAALQVASETLTVD
jgi:polyhydroxyalkanoate synthesis regulator phasin